MAVARKLAFGKFGIELLKKAPPENSAKLCFKAEIGTASSLLLDANAARNAGAIQMHCKKQSARSQRPRDVAKGLRLAAPDAFDRRERRASQWLTCSPEEQRRNMLNAEDVPRGDVGSSEVDECDRTS
jgi:hypothetical protein